MPWVRPIRGRGASAGLFVVESGAHGHFLVVESGAYGDFFVVESGAQGGPPFIGWLARDAGERLLGARG